ncbi:mannose 6-phosphate receptor domain-containing protein [Schizophyllum commune Loenen D]|nr:mannose 6-phosphate receptor domain-containing protein [Schizophyllum commune Loenen D]
MLLATLLISLPLTSLAAEPKIKPCTAYDPINDNFFNLAPLKAARDYTFGDEASDSGTEYLINICRPVETETWHVAGADVIDIGDVGAFVRRDRGDFSMGQANSTLDISPTTGEPRLSYLNGSPCPLDGSVRASTIIDFVCSTSDFGAGKPRLTATLPTGASEGERCVFFVEWATHHACPARQPASLSLAALITGLLVALLLTTALYLVCGTAYNRWVLGLNGFDQIPSFSWDAFAYHANAVYAHLRSEGFGPVLRHIKAAAARKFSKDNLLDMFERFREATTNLYEGGQSGRLALGHGHGNMGRYGSVNPVSHQAFVRPEMGSPSPRASPSSHNARLSPRASPSPTPRNRTGDGARLAPVGVPSEQTPFMLGQEDDEEEDIARTPVKVSSTPAPAGDK